MGDFNQFLWVEKNKRLMEGPVLEIGSKFYDKATFNDFRSLADGKEYIGTDLQEGQNVDLVVDFTKSIEEIRSHLGERQFGSIICCSVLEHVDDIWSFVQNTTQVIKPGGTLYLSVPFIWEFHGYPSDYWRFTPAGVLQLFKEFEFPENYQTISSDVDYDMASLGSSPNDFIMAQHDHSLDHVSIGAVRKLWKMVKIMTSGEYRQQWMASQYSRNRYKKCCINMIGIKKK